MPGSALAEATFPFGGLGKGIPGSELAAENAELAAMMAARRAERTHNTFRVIVVHLLM